MRICFVGHVFHERTQSSRFFLDILKRMGEVTVLLVDPDGDALANDPVIRAIINEPFDRYVFWQSEAIAELLLPFDLGPSFIVPMFDAVQTRSAEFWQKFVKYHILSFCRSHHEALQAAHCRTSYFQYFPEPSPEPLFAADQIDAFFWERRPNGSINRHRVLAQCRQLGITRLHLHAAADLAKETKAHSSGRYDGIDVIVSRWFEQREEYEAVVAAPLFFFAPRPLEGIGMATLEAMGRGQIVVAPDLPTQNEYIADGVSGMLYDWTNVAAATNLPNLSSEELTRMSAAAHRKIVEGRTMWLKDISRLQSIIADDGRRWPTSDAASAFIARIRRSAHESSIRHVG